MIVLVFCFVGSGWYEIDFKKDGDKKCNLVGDVVVVLVLVVVFVFVFVLVVVFVVVD